MAKKRKRKPGTLIDLQKLLWKALRTAEDLLDDATTQAEEGEGYQGVQLRAIHAISQASGQYTKLLEIGELEERIVALEAAQRGHHR